MRPVFAFTASQAGPATTSPGNGSSPGRLTKMRAMAAAIEHVSDAQAPHPQTCGYGSRTRESEKMILKVTSDNLKTNPASAGLHPFGTPVNYCG